MIIIISLITDTQTTTNQMYKVDVIFHQKRHNEEHACSERKNERKKKGKARATR